MTLHIALPVPVLDAKANPLGVPFRADKRALATALIRAAAIQSGTPISQAELLAPTPAQVLAIAATPILYHMLVADTYNYAAVGAVYAAQWDGRAPYVTVLLGNPHALTMEFAGWPRWRKVQWDARQALLKAAFDAWLPLHDAWLAARDAWLAANPRPDTPGPLLTAWRAARDLWLAANPEPVVAAVP